MTPSEKTEKEIKDLFQQMEARDNNEDDDDLCDEIIRIVEEDYEKLMKIYYIKYKKL